ncbi:hypothetical protein D3C72_452880 [compost metagenome]
MIQTALDVLDHDDGVIDHQADGQNQGQQGQQVQRETERRQNDEGRQQADGRHHRRDDRRPQTAQEDEVDQGHQSHRNTDGDPDLVDGVRGEDRVVGPDLQRGARRQGRFDLLHQGACALGDGQVVGLSLAGDGQADLIDAVAAEQAPRLGRGLLDPGDVAQARDIGRVAHKGPGHAIGHGGGRRRQRARALRARRRRSRTTRADRQLGEVGWPRIGAGHANGVVLLRRLQRAGGQFDVLIGQGRLDVIDRQPARSHGAGVQPDTHGIALLAVDLHLSHARHGGEAIDQIAVGVVGQLQTVHGRGAQEHDDDRLAVRVGLGHFGRVSLIRQTADDARDAVAHIVGRVVDIPIQRELDVDVGATVATGRVDALDTLDARDLLLDRLGDPAFDDLGRGSGVAGVDRDDGRIDVRQFAHRQEEEGRQADHAQDDGRHRRKDGAADRNIGQHHLRAA